MSSFIYNNYLWIFILLLVLPIVIMAYMNYNKIDKRICRLELKTLKINRKVTGLKLNKKQWKNLKKNTYNDCFKRLKPKKYSEKLEILASIKKEFKKIKKN